MTTLLLLVHFAATWYLVGLCWLVQRVQYPLMATVGEDAFVDYERAHVHEIGPVVAPPMLVEAGTALALIGIGGPLFRRPEFLIAFGLLALIWLSTFAVQVPLHAKLSNSFDPSAHALLVRTNWIRTIGWTLRGGLLVGLMLVWSGDRTP